jgi:hypothetical protein
MLGHSIVSQHFMEPVGSIPNSQSSPPVPILSQTNPARTVICYVNIPLSQTYRSISYGSSMGHGTMQSGSSVPERHTASTFWFRPTKGYMVFSPKYIT